jgi:hypothetical protein
MPDPAAMVDAMWLLEPAERAGSGFAGRTESADFPQTTPQRRVIRELLSRGYWALRRRSAFIRCSLRGSRRDVRFEARRLQHADNLPELSDENSDILADLRKTGVAVRPVKLPTAVGDSARRFAELLCSKRTDAPCAKTTSRELAWDPTLFMWGLSDELLDLAECHIGLAPRYLGVEVKREMVNPAAGHTHQAVRRWHLDHEDRRILKVIVYLSDVDSASGPFEYLDLPTSTVVLSGMDRPCRSARLDERVRAEAPTHKRRQVTGPPMTAIYVDTGQVVHRVSPPLDRERYSVTFGYCSRRPYLTYSQLMLPASALRALREDLSRRQCEALRCERIGRSSAARCSSSL